MCVCFALPLFCAVDDSASVCSLSSVVVGLCREYLSRGGSTVLLAVVAGETDYTEEAGAPRPRRALWTFCFVLRSSFGLSSLDGVLADLAAEDVCPFRCTHAVQLFCFACMYYVGVIESNTPECAVEALTWKGVLL